MIVISDTNILSSLAVGEAFPTLFQLFASSEICIPPAVFAELQQGCALGKMYLEPVLQAIKTQQIEVIALSVAEEQLIPTYPHRLNLGECEAIALTQTRQALLLSNDKRAVRYCQTQGLRVWNLENILRQLWLQNILSRYEVKKLIDRMAQIENLVIPPERQKAIFAPRYS
ncbi:MAG: hypothetical protein U0350_29005 [Caldilineaceae bacterium]